MEFKAKDRRLDGETVLRQCQLIEQYLLDVFVEICKEHNLRYFLAYGTLLGAMRHNGFIPWDDDVDVGMPEEDYERFRKLAPSFLPENVILDDPRVIKGSACPIIRLRDRSSFTMCASTMANYPSGIYMDIYPYVRYPRLPRKLSRMLMFWCSETWLNVWIHRTIRHSTSTGILISWMKAVVWHVLKILVFGTYWVLRAILPKVWHGPLTVEMPPDGGDPSEFDEKALFPLSQHEFEGKAYSVPHDPDAYLTQRYGDWRKLPPEDKRVWHHSIICPTQAPNEWWARPYKKN